METITNAMKTMTIEDKCSLKPERRDFQNVRNTRQTNNNSIVYESLLEGDTKTLHKHINQKEYERTLTDLEYTDTEFIAKCRTDYKFAKLASRLISKNASRQGSKDETEQIRTCNIIANKCGVSIKNLTATEFRPTKDGEIVSYSEFKQRNLPKDDCLKSFDGQITGKITGFISAKVVYGNGGHQDNVFEEMDVLADWWKNHKHGKCHDILVLLIDTDHLDKVLRLREKYSMCDTVFIFDHIEFQQYIIDKTRT